MNFDRTIELTGLIGIFYIAQILKFQVPFYKKFLLTEDKFLFVFFFYILRLRNTKIILLRMNINGGLIM